MTDYMTRLTKDEIKTRLEAVNWDFEEFPLYFTLEPSVRNIDLLIKHREAVAAYRLFFKDVYAHDASDPDYNWEETDFNGVTLGFLIAKGVPARDAHMMTSFLRYNLQYFDVDPAIA